MEGEKTVNIPFLPAADFTTIHWERNEFLPLRFYAACSSPGCHDHSVQSSPCLATALSSASPIKAKLSSLHKRALKGEVKSCSGAERVCSSAYKRRPLCPVFSRGGEAVAPWGRYHKHGSTRFDWLTDWLCGVLRLCAPRWLEQDKQLNEDKQYRPQEDQEVWAKTIRGTCNFVI